MAEHNKRKKTHGGKQRGHRASEPVYDLYNNYVKEAREIPPITRLMYSVLVKDNNSEEMEKDVSEWVMNTNAEKLKEESLSGYTGYTGFMILKGNFALHFVENHPNEMEEYLAYLKAEKDKPNSVYERITIIAFNEENSERVLPGWQFYRIFYSGEVMSEVEKNNEDTINRIWVVYRLFLETANKMEALLEGGFDNQVQVKEFASGIQSQLTNEDIYLLVYGPYPTIEQYWELIYDDEEIVLDDELSFPQNCNYTQYLEYLDQRFSSYNHFCG